MPVPASSPVAAPAATSPPPRLASYRDIRNATERLCAPLQVEDCALQSMPDTSPIKWHLAHTSWFFETFVLSPVAGYTPFHAQYEQLFNSYYHAVGEPFARARRGMLTRPSLDEVRQYRAYV